jgi:putative ABC transport system permease protein
MLENHLKPTYLIIQVMGIITLIIALAGLLIVLNLSLQERVREMGIMKAVGSSVNAVVNMYHREYLFIAIISLAAGILFGNLLNAAICNLFGVMVIQVPVQPLVDNKVLLFTIMAVPAVQTLLISVYIRRQIIKTSAGMLSRVF